MTVTASVSPAIEYHGLAHLHLLPPRFLMRPLLNGGTLADKGGLRIMTSGHVFLSHNNGDKEFVRRLASDLRERGATVWLDEWELRVGDSLVERIEAAIQQAGYLAIVLSSRSVESGWVRRELNAALSEEMARRGVFILPVLLEDCDLPLFLRDKMYADFREKYASGLKAILKVLVPGEITPPKVIFDSDRDDPRYATWTLYCSAGVDKGQFHCLRDSDGKTYARFSSSKDRSTGINKSVATLHGRAVFEYRISHVDQPGSHIYFALIPIQETGFYRAGVIEVGGAVQDDPRNALSSHRVRYVVPTSHQTDKRWHVATVDFDFRDTPSAFYAIFAPRINEGTTNAGTADVEVKNVQIYSW